MKIYKMAFTFVVALCWPQSAVVAQPASKFVQAIICLTYDDGLASHLSVVVPQLDSAGLKGTFFINSIQGSADVIGQASPALLGWKKVAGTGHELGNHTLFHPCPQKLGWPENVAIETYTLKRILEEIRTENAFLQLIDNKKAARSFAFPCNNTLVQGDDYSKAIRKAQLAKYGRTGGDSNSIIKDLNKIDPMLVPSWLVEEGTSLNQLIEFAEKVKQTGGMAVYQFHGIGGQFFQVSPTTHRKFLAYLNDNKQYFRVTTFSDAMKIVTTE